MLWRGFVFWVGLLLVVGLGAGLGASEARSLDVPRDDDRETAVKIRKGALPSFYGGYVAGPLNAVIDGRTHSVRLTLSLEQAVLQGPGLCETSAYPGQAHLMLWDARTSRLVLQVDSWSFDPKEAAAGGDVILRKLEVSGCREAGVGIRMSLQLQAQAQEPGLQFTFSRAPERIESSRVSFEPALDTQIRFRKLSSGEGSR